MEINNINYEILRGIYLLSFKQKQKLLEFIYTIVDVPKFEHKTLLSFAGCILPQDISVMKISIEQDCNKIDENEW